MIKIENTPIKQLNSVSLNTCKNSTVSIPTYPRDRRMEGTVHLGVGDFHRSHLAVYVQRLLQEHGVKDWSICGVGSMKGDSLMRDTLQSQDCLYTVVERDISKCEAYIVGSITSYMYAPENPKAVIAKMADPNTHIVSLTVTETGYYHSEATNSLISEAAEIKNDLNCPETPCTIYGYLYEALLQRYKNGQPPFTIMSCDNMPQNGTTVKAALIEFASLRNNDFAKWLAKEIASPNSMVDRVTPRATDVEKRYVAETWGIEDKCPVVTEPFIQWVLEDTFSDGHPPWELAGIQVVADVEPYELMKLRLLNGGHSAMGYLGCLAGYTYIHEVVNDITINKYISALMREEIIPLLPPVPGVDVENYALSILERFSNPAIQDQVSRICMMGSGKMPKYILPSIYEEIERTDKKYRLLSMCLAGWFRYLTGINMSGRPFPIEDPMSDELKEAACRGGSNPRELLNIKVLFSKEIRKNEAFIAELTDALMLLYEKGPVVALETIL